jgi:SAM-dependent methyltransferase
VSANPYASARYLHEYLLFHYGRPRDICPFAAGISREVFRFHLRLREECLLPISERREAPPCPTRGLDLGCGVGRFTFELARVLDEVLGLDSSAPFIRAAKRLAAGRPLTVRVHESGRQFVSRTIAPPAFRRGVVHFRVADALRLEGLQARAFDVVAAINLLCRLSAPGRFLAQLHRLLRPGGQLLLTSPYSWLGQYTPRRHWLSSDDLKALLRPRFHLVRRRELPLLIREHARKCQLVIPEVLTFRKRDL